MRVGLEDSVLARKDTTENTTANSQLKSQVGSPAAAELRFASLQTSSAIPHPRDPPTCHTKRSNTAFPALPRSVRLDAICNFEWAVQAGFLVRGDARVVLVRRAKA